MPSLLSLNRGSQSPCAWALLAPCTGRGWAVATGQLACQGDAVQRLRPGVGWPRLTAAIAVWLLRECCRLGRAGQATFATVVAWLTWCPPHRVIHLPAQTSLPLLLHHATACVAALPARRAASAPHDRCPASCLWRAPLGVMPPNSSTSRQPPRPVCCAHGAVLLLIDRCRLVLTHSGSVVWPPYRCTVCRATILPPLCSPARAQLHDYSCLWAALVAGLAPGSPRARPSSRARQFWRFGSPQAMGAVAAWELG
jgi:hypothetical protein